MTGFCASFATGVLLEAFLGLIPRIKSHFILSEFEALTFLKMFELQHFTQFILTKEKARCSISSNNNDLESEIISTSAPNRKAKSSLQPTVLRVCEKDKRRADKLLANFIISNNLIT